MTDIKYSKSNLSIFPLILSKNSEFPICDSPDLCQNTCCHFFDSDGEKNCKYLDYFYEMRLSALDSKIRVNEPPDNCPISNLGVRK